MKLGLTKRSYQEANAYATNDMPHRMPCQRVEEQVDTCGGKEEDHRNNNIDDIVELRVSNPTHDDKGKVDPYDDGLVGPTIVIVSAMCM